MMIRIEITIKWIVEKLNPKVAPPQKKKEQKQANNKTPVICNLDTCLIKMIKTEIKKVQVIP